jgi:hypothetical protein
MTPQEIINEICKLPLPEQKEVFDRLSEELTKAVQEELRLQETLLAKGLVRNVRPPRRKKIGDFEAIIVKGKPISETIIEERR